MERELLKKFIKGNKQKEGENENEILPFQGTDIARSLGELFNVLIGFDIV